MSEKDRQSPLFVASIEKGMKVLQVFASDRRELRLSEIVQATGLDRSAAQRFVYSLNVLGYLRQDPRTKLFRLSPKTLELGFSYLRSDPLIEVALPLLQQCRQETHETVNLSELDDTNVVFVARVPGEHAVNVNVSVGSVFPVFCTAPGRAMLAYMEPERVEDLLKRADRRAVTQHTIVDLDRIRTEIREAATRGFSIAYQEIYVGEISVAAPVFDMSAKPVGAVNIPVPTVRWTVDAVRADLAPVVVKFADRITQQSGGSRP